MLEVEIRVGQAQSLKEKRMVLSSLKAALRRRFNVAVAEVDAQDRWQRAVLAVAAVGSDQQYVNGQLNHVLNYIEKERHLEVSDCRTEFY